jgi:hypothetical protein
MRTTCVSSLNDAEGSEKHDGRLMGDALEVLCFRVLDDFVPHGWGVP